MKTPRIDLHKGFITHETFRLPASIASVWMRRGEMLGSWLNGRLTALRKAAAARDRIAPPQQTGNAPRVLQRRGG